MHELYVDVYVFDAVVEQSDEELQFDLQVFNPLSQYEHDGPPNEQPTLC